MEKLKIVLFKENASYINSFAFLSSKEIVEQISEEIYIKQDAGFYCVDTKTEDFQLVLATTIKENEDLFNNEYFFFRALMKLTNKNMEYFSEKDARSLLNSFKTGIVEPSIQTLGLEFECVSRIVGAIESRKFSNYEIEIEERESPN